MLAGPAETLPRTVEELLGRDLAARLDRLDLLSRKMLAGKLPGERRSKRRGRSVEFDDFRDYVPGDDLRHIDWNVLARLDKLFIKLFREEEDLALHIIVDASASMNAGGGGGGGEGTPNKLVYAHQLAMALAYVGVVKQNRVSVATFGQGIAAGAGGEGGAGSSLRQLSPVRGRTGVHYIASFLLESLDAAQKASTSTGAVGIQNPPDIAKALKTFARTRRGKGIAVVLSDFLTPSADVAPLLPGLNAIALTEAGGFDSYCLQILSPGELDPRPLTRLSGARGGGLIGDLRLTDVETGRAAEVSISPALIARYRARVDQYIAEVRKACRARGIGHFLVPTNSPIDELVVTSLRRGGMLR